jgi:hypothetical protein
MSHMTRKNGSGVAGAGRRARKKAASAVPLAKDAGATVKERAVPLAKNAGVTVKERAVPLAKNAGVTVKERAGDVAAWASPHVREARAWAAPHVEATGTAVQEKIAPQVSDILTRAARQLDPAPVRRRRSRLARGIVLLAAAASAVAVLALVRRQLPRPGCGGADAEVTDPVSGSGDQASGPDDDETAAHADVNGQVRTS